MLAQEVFHAHVLRAQRVFRVEAVVAPPLPRGKACDIRAAGRNADADVEANAPIDAAVEHARGVDPPHAAADVDQRRFHQTTPKAPKFIHSNLK